MLVITKQEFVDPKRVNLLIDSNVLDDKTAEKLKSYRKRVSPSGSVYSMYNPGKGGCSRLYVKGVGLQNLPNDVVNFIAPGYSDVDMVNCAFTILQNLFQDYGIECPEVDSYVKNRKEILDKYGLTKNDMTATLFKDYIPKDKTSLPKEILKLHESVYQNLLPLLVSDDRYSRFFVENRKYNKNGYFLSMTLFHIENSILLKLQDFLVSRNFIPAVLKFDGMLVEKDERLTDEFLEECSEFIKNETGFKINFIIKPTPTKYEEKDLIPFKMDVSEIPDQEKKFVEIIVEHVKGMLIDHLNVAKLFMLISPHTVLKDIGGQSWSLAKDNFWIYANNKDDGDLHLRIYEDIKYFSLKHEKYIKSEFPLFKDLVKEKFHKILDKLGSRSWRRSVESDVVCLTSPISNAVEKLMSKPHLVAFSDGVFDLIEGKFRDVHPEDFALRGTGYKFPKKSDPAIRNKIKEIHADMFSTKEMADFRFLTIASSLYGKHIVEIFVCLFGLGRNGKGAENKLIQAAFGGYFYSLEKQNLLASAVLADKPNSQMYATAFKRYISVREPAKSEVLKSDIIKWMTGGDSHTVRKPHDSVSLTFPIAGMVTIQTNHPLRYDEMDYAVCERSKVTKYPYQFVTEPSSKNEKFLDTSLKELFVSDAYRDEFMLMLIDTFRENFVKDGKVNIQFEYPKEVQSFTVENLALSLNCKDWFSSFCVATGHHNDKVLRSELWNSFIDNAFNLTPPKQRDFFRDLDKVFRCQKYNGQYYYYGLRKKTEKDDQLVDE